MNKTTLRFNGMIKKGNIWFSLTPDKQQTNL